MVAARPLPALSPVDFDQRVVLHGVSWQAYEALLAWRGDRGVPRMTYLEGELEFTAPARRHETDKKRLARLLEAWAEETGMPFEGVGSWTVKNPDVERGAEADECYVLGDPEAVDAPDIAIEVVWKHAGIDKLEVWRKLGAREVWVWQAGALTIHVLRRQRYAASPKSALLPKLDPALIERCMTCASQSEAVGALRAALRLKRRRR
ncbi:MAG TPA: Uma2 family endonuclease [Byssovorax sp.]|jgi:Uma2 family endonuclease